MLDPSMSQLLSSILVAVITGLVSIVVAYIQTSRKSQSRDPSIALPKGVSLRRQRRSMWWIIALMILGGVVGYLVGGLSKNIATDTVTMGIFDDFSVRSSRWHFE